MRYNLVPRNFWTFPTLPSIWEEEEDLLTIPTGTNGLSISEDDKNIYVEAQVPGIDPKDVEVTFDKGMLWIKGEAKEEEKKKKYYRRAMRSFSYRVALPTDIDAKAEPEATCKNGVMIVKFAKSPKSQPKKIAVKIEEKRQEK